MHLLGQETTVNIPGPSGNLEGLLALPKQNKIKKIGIICHPHPLRGGTMHNKVISTTSRVFSELGIANLRFNFRGVGKSAGHYGNTLGEAEDLLAAIQWLLNTHPEHAIWLAGFSFGSYISAYIAAQYPVELLISIAPPVNNFDFISLKEIACPWIVVQGDIDEIVPSQEVYAWIKSIEHPIELIRIPTTGHFFHGHLTELRDQLTSSLSNHVN
jgi:alpha/beta superfamily hydrolase